MTALDAPAEEGVGGLAHHLPLAAAVFPALQNSITKVGAVLGFVLAFKASAHSDESGQIFVLPGDVTSGWAGLAELIDQFHHIDALPAAGGLCALCCGFQGDGITRTEPLGDLLDAGECCRSTRFRPLIRKCGRLPTISGADLKTDLFQAADNVPGVTTGEVNGATEGFEPVLSHVQQYASACDQLVTVAGIKQVLLESTGAGIKL